MLKKKPIVKPLFLQINANLYMFAPRRPRTYYMNTLWQQSAQKQSDIGKKNEKEKGEKRTELWNQITAKHNDKKYF